MIENKLGDCFDAVYGIHKKKSTNKFIDYSQIYQDFGIDDDEIEKRVMIVSPIDLETEELRDRKRDELLFIEPDKVSNLKSLISE
jgi:hypothetical protein